MGDKKENSYSHILKYTGLFGSVQGLQKKYETTYFDIEKEIKETEASLCSMIDDLVGDEYDMKGLSELKSLLSGE